MLITWLCSGRCGALRLAQVRRSNYEKRLKFLQLLNPKLWRGEGGGHCHKYKVNHILPIIHDRNVLFQVKVLQ